LRNRPTGSLTPPEREQLVTIAQKWPSIDLEINFDYNSDTIGPKATPALTSLGQAISSDEFKHGTFIIAGYSDAKGDGTYIYNQGLAERRADAVKRFLVEKYGMDPANLVTVGYGPGDRVSGDNRRGLIKVINVSDK
jgi:outer membrane protein OmpA-like peptidoglycan-associated protein